MAKYKDQGRKYGKKILAVLLAVATVLTTSSIDMQALAAIYGGMGGNDKQYTISPGNSLGEVITNSGQANPNQKVNNVSFQIWQEAFKSYNFQVTLYENPTKSDNPTSGVNKGTFPAEIENTTVDQATVVTVDVSSANIVLTEGESLWVVAEYISGPNNLNFYETTGGTGGTGYRNQGYGWTDEDGKNIIKVETVDYTDPLNDASVKTFTVNPDKSFISVGDTLTLNSIITPAYKRDVTYESSNTNVISKPTDDTTGVTTATALKSGTATISATCRADSTDKKSKEIKVVETKLTYPDGKTSYAYDPAGVKPNITVTFGTDLSSDNYEIEYGGSYPNVGTATATVKGTAGSVIEGYTSNPISFTISEKPLTSSMINEDTIVVDTVKDEFTSATLTDGAYKLSTPDDYEVTDVTRTSASTTEIKYSITFSGRGNYSGDVTVEKTFTAGSTTIDINSIFDTEKTKINKPAEELVFQNKNIYIRNDEIQFYDKNGKEVVDFDEDNFEIIQAKNPANQGTYTITVKGKEDQGYKGSFTLKYTITRRPLTDGTDGMRITVTPDSYVHDKTAKSPTVTVTYNNGETIEELDSNDFSITTSDNIDIGEATVVVKGKGNYQGNVTKHFNIIPDFTNDATIVIGNYPTTNEGLSGYHTTYPFGSTEPSIELYMSNDPKNPKETQEKVDESKYSLSFEDTDSAGKAKVVLTGLYEYAGKTVTAYFTIDGKDIKNYNVAVTTPTKQYTGKEVTLSEENEYTVYYGTDKLVYGRDYTVTYSPNVDTGVVTMTISGKGNYTGTNTKGKFTITPRPIEDLDVQMDTWNYTGTQIKATPESVKLDGVDIDSSNYELSWGDNIGPGTGTVTLTAKANTAGKTNFTTTGSKTVEFTINPKSLLGATFYVGVDDASLIKCNTTTDPYTYDAAQTFMYTGSEVKPVVKITDGGTTLTPGTDYTVKYYNNTEAGPAYLKITGNGPYAGTTGKITINYTIKKKSIKNDTDVNLKTPSYEWREISGTKYVFPSVTVTDKTTGKALTEAERNADGTYKMVGGKYVGDYIIESTATAVGENLTATIKGVNNYDVEGGDVTVTYNAGKNIAGASVSILLPNGGVVEKDESTKVYEVTYIGQNHPDIHVIDGKALTEETDFHINWPSSLIYDANKGTNTVTIEGMGDYYGTVETKYKIIPKNLSTTTDPEGKADIVVSDGTTKVYDGKTYDIAPAIKYFVYRAPSGSGKQDIIVNLTKGSNADYTTDPNSIGADVTGDDTITATVEGQNNYTGTVTSSGYGINQRSINDDYIEIEGLNAKEYYTGSQITPEPTIYLTNGETDRSKWIKLTKGTDYDVTYGENVNTSGTVSISGKGNYKDACVKTFTIEKRSILDDTITIRVEDKKTYNGEAQKPYVELVSTIGSETYYLRETVDYVLICPQDLNPNDESNVLVGEGNATSGPRVTIKGIGKYSGETTKGFRITGNLNDSEYFQVGGLDGQAVDQKYYTINKSVSGYSVDFGSAYNIQYADSAHKGTEVSPHSECTLTQPSTIAPGKRTATVTSSNSLLTGDCAKEVELHGSLADLSTVEVNTNQPYTGYPVEPVPTLVKYNNVDLTGSSAYKVTYDDDHTSVGTHKLYLRPNSDYYTDQYGPIDYTVSYDLGKADVTLSYWTTTYNGTEQKPEVTSVKVGANTVPESEYTVSYSADTTNSGKKTVTVTGTGSTLTGIATAEYTINPRTLTNNNTNITLDQTDWDYTGKEIKPVVTVECTELGVTDKTLKLGSDYTVAYPEDRISAGNKVITINATTDGLANYRGSVTATYNVKKGTLNADEIQVSDAIYAGGYEVTPTITGTFNGKEINPDTDLEIVSNTSDTPNWGVGTATIKLKGKGNFAETPIITKTYNIVAANLNDTTIELEDNWHEYTGSDLTSTAEDNMVVKIDAGGGNFVPLTYGTHYTLQLGDGGEMTNHGQYSVKIIAVPGSNYTGTVSDPTKYYYTVNEKYIDQDDIVVTLNKYQWEYEEVPVNPIVTVYDSSRGEYLTEGEDADYTVYTYDNTEAGVGTVEITGHGNYYGYKNTNFTIGHVFNADVSLDKEEFYYDGSNSLHQPDTIVTQDGVTLEKDKDYSVQYKNVNDDGSYSDLDGNAGEKIAEVKGINNYTGNFKTKKYIVKAKTADASKIHVVPDLSYESGHYYEIYTGDYIRPAVKVYDYDISTTVPVDPENYVVDYDNNKDMTKSGNYAKIYVNWKDRGTKSNYTTGSDAYTTEFEIKAKEVKPGDFEATIVDETPGQSKIYAYTGDVIKPKVSVRDVNQDIYLTEGTDYVLSYTDNVKAGTGYVTVKGLNNYSGTVTLDFTIQAQMSDAVAPIPDQLFTGEPVKPKFTVTCGGNTLVEGVDYNVSYRSDDDYQTSGVAKIDTNSPYYSGSKEIKYNIVFDPSLLTVTNYNPTYTYTGGSIRPDFVVQAPDGTIIPYDKNAVTYMNSSTGAGDTTSIGTITASIPVTIGTPENHKTAVLKAVYSIVSKNVNNASVTVARLADNVYTGKALTPPVYIKDGNTQLTEGVDYTLSYSNNTNPGVGTVIITGKGEYEGQRSEPFYIIAPKVLGLTGTVGSDSSVTLSWLKNAHVSGYDIYSQDGSKKYGSTTTNSFNIPASKAGNETVFKVRTYVTVNGKRTDGEFSEVTVYTGLAKPVVTITSYARKRATLNWSPQTNVSGYEIYRGTSPDGNFSKIAVMPTTSGGYSDSGLTSGQTYYYKVRAYQKTGENAFVYGHFSDVKSVVVK